MTESSWSSQWHLANDIINKRDDGLGENSRIGQAEWSGSIGTGTWH